jgi:arylsulfatase A-like enzyme
VNRRSFLTALAGTAVARAQSAPRPNIIVFLSDDMGWEQVGFTGGKEVPTPNIDSIAENGVKMTQFYVQPVCTPTRGCLMTGRYAWKNGTERRPSTFAAQGMLKDERTVAQALRDAGYATWMVGKWHLGEWQTAHLPRSRGFDHHYGFYGALIDSYTHTREGILDWHRNGVPIVEEGYSSFLFADEASRLIKDHDGKKPFFLYLPFNAVHGPNQAPEGYKKKYAHLGRTGPQRAQLECMDIAIGRVLKAVRDKGIESKTLVVFTNDNGGPHRMTNNGPYKGHKSDYHEGGIRVPFAAQWRDLIKPGSASNEMLHVTDLFPTFCGLAGADIRKGLPLDGKDAWPALSGKGKASRTEIVHSLQVIREGDWKLIEQGATYYSWPEQPLQLYNIAQDASEKNNLAAEKPEIVARLRERLAYHRKFAREEEPQMRIPGEKPATYSEEENSKYGAAVREKIRALGLKEGREKEDRPRRAEQEKRRNRK